MTTATSLALRVLDFIRRHGLCRGGETVLVAVSGGADSVALLDVLSELAPSLQLALHVAHVDHGLRAAAAEDARFVEGLCASLGVPFHLARVEVRREPPWDGLEAEARRARYRALDALARTLHASRIATGHTADDQAETVLMRLCQGSGPRGLAGIAPERGLLIRPLLQVRREEIEAHLRARGLAWVEDTSNRDTRLLRNRIRHEVLPFLAERWGGDVVLRLCRSAALTRAWVIDLERRAGRELDRLGRHGPEGFVLPVEALRALPGELAAETVRRALAALGETRPLRGAAERGLRRLVAAETPRRALRLGPVVVERSGRWLRVGPAALPPLEARTWEVPGQLDLPEIGMRLEARCFERAPDYAPPREPGSVAFDADRVPAALAVRGRRPGDRFVPFGGSPERRLKSLLIDAAVPRWERPRVPLLEAGGEILWVAGLRRGRAAPVDSGTRRILQVTLRAL
ncbi:MAG TPA: tRNA lysidine(34) synthetase TilS [Methylomirabilota bacterium]|nr:tRNA lysidine(34) synthetase TilS [Methylomirabilota bacterium]